MSLEEAWDKLRQRAAPAAHRSPRRQRPASRSAVRLLHGAAARASSGSGPDIHLKCFTAVEIAFFADLYGMTDEQVLRELMAAGLDSLPGGGAEIFAERVRRKIAHDKCGTDRYLEIHRTAHRLGMRSNVTMLYGHIETAEERVDHMLRARALQDETGGFQAFIPLAFHPDNNQMRKLPAPSAADTLRVHAVARLMLDNIPHVKAFWIATGVEVAQTSLWFGVDDLDGTVQEEKIYHMAGARTPEAMTTREIARLIRAAGREPVERDTLYNVVAHRLTRPERPAGMPDQLAPVLYVMPGSSRCAVLGFFASRHCEKFHKRGSRLMHACCSGPDRLRERAHLPSASRCPSAIVGLSDEEMDARIAAARATLGRRLVILGHHYQRDEVIKFADYIGDSYKLAQPGQQAPRRRVHRLLRRALHGRERRRAERRPPAGDPAGSRRRLLDGRHGRPRSARDVLERSRADGHRRGDGVRSVASSRSPTSTRPRRSKRSAASTAASSARRRTRRRRCSGPGSAASAILFLPDQHLGRNTAYKMGVPLDEMVVWDPNEIWGGARAGRGRSGRASSSGRATARSTRASPSGRSRTLRAQHPGVRVIVHPEVPWDVVQAADDSGSTEYIINQVKTSPRRIGLGGRHRDPSRQPAGAARCSPSARCCRSISSAACARRCSASRRTICCGCSKGCVDGEVHNRIVVPDDQKHWTKVALDRMLSIQ